MTGPKLFDSRREPDAWFAEFWTLYPRREAKQDALKAMAELQPDEPTKAAIRQALAWQVHKEQWLRGIIPLPASWLRGRRWEDEPPQHAGFSERTIRNFQAATAWAQKPH